jgi:hypothetical protein
MARASDQPDTEQKQVEDPASSFSATAAILPL